MSGEDEWQEGTQFLTEIQFYIIKYEKHDEDQTTWNQKIQLQVNFMNSKLNKTFIFEGAWTAARVTLAADANKPYIGFAVK